MAPGFVPAAVLDDRRVSRTENDDGRAVDALPKREAVCQRCHGLRFQNKLPVDALRVGSSAAQHAELQPEHFRNLLRGISRRRAIVLAVVDLFDFDGSFTPDLPQIVGPSNPLIVVANKVDLLPAAANAVEVQRWVRRACARQGVERIHQIHLVSCKSGAGVEPLLDNLQAMMRERNMDAYVVGAANAGKSSFLNRALKQLGGRPGGGDGGSAPAKKPVRKGAETQEEGTLTTSHLPGTTLDFVRIAMPSKRQALYDTPGLIVPAQLTTLLTTAELAAVVPKKRGEVVSLRLAEGKAVLLGGLAQVHMRTGLPFIFTFYLANAVKVHPTASDKADATLRKHVGGLLCPPASLERYDELGTFHEQTFRIRGRGWDEVAVDLVLPGLGWVAVTGSGECSVSVAVPPSVTVSQREPMLRDGKIWRKAAVKFTGSKLTDKKGHARRRS